jgi:hypothetical protein
VHWPGIEQGNSRELALSKRLDRRFQRLLQVVAFNWVDSDLTRFPTAKYREDHLHVLVPILGRNGKEDPDLYALLWISPEEEDAETYLIVTFMSKRRKIARVLSEQASQLKQLRMQGLRSSEPREHQWLMRALPLSRIETEQPERQLSGIETFVRETVDAVTESGLLDMKMPRGKHEEAEDES